jgi:hypothetical protein
MNTGLDDTVVDPYCTDPECLLFKAPVGITIYASYLAYEAFLFNRCRNRCRNPPRKRCLA